MPQTELTTGIRGVSEICVAEESTAAAAGSGGLAVYATPCMIALMEMTAAKSVQPYLTEGCSTVGTHIDIKHLSATPVGMWVRVETELIQIDRRKLTFRCQASDAAGPIGEGVQERFIVDNGRFMERAGRKLK